MGSYLNFGRFGGGGGAIAAHETVAGSTDGTSITLTFSSLTDASQCVPFLSVRTTGSASGFDYTGKVMWDADVFDDAGTVKCTLTRGADDAPTYNFRVTLLQFADHVTVSKTSMASGGYGLDAFRDITVPALVAANSFALAYHQSANDSSSNFYGHHTNAVARITGTTTVRVYGPDSITASGTVYTVYDSTGGIEVTHAYGSEANTSTWTQKDLTFSAVTPSERLLIGGYRGAGNTAVRPRRFSSYAEFLDSTTVRFYRIEGYNNGLEESEFTAQLVKMPGMTVQHGTHTWVAGDNSEAKAIASVDVASSFALTTLPYSTFNGTDAADFDAGALGYLRNRVTLTNATTVTVDRGNDTDTLAGGIGYQVATLAL